MDELEKIIQRMMAAGEKSDRIKEVVRAYKESQKPKAVDVIPENLTSTKDYSFVVDLQVKINK